MSMIKQARIFYVNNESNEPFKFRGPVVITSGGYDPIHPGHASYLIEAKLKGCEELFSSPDGVEPAPWNLDLATCTHVAVVNGDWFLTQKKGRPFMPLRDRCEIVASIKGVDIVVGLDTTGDMTVNKALELIKPTYFAKGGDRTGIENIPEWETCQRLGVQILTEIGAGKEWSSSDYLAEWGAEERNRGLDELNSFMADY